MTDNCFEKYKPIYEYYNISSHQLEQLKEYKNLILHWNKKHNLISRKSEDDIWERHILNSLQLLDFIDTKNNINPIKTNLASPTSRKIIDIGSGGGFPGIILNIMLPNDNITLIDSCQKKITTLNDIIDSLQLKNINTICDRIENIHLSCDIITARALASIPKILQLTHQIKHKKMLLLKGKSVHNEINKELTKKCLIHQGKLDSLIIEINSIS
ncbi:MAG: 16S rRNA (guanine(527)-N(7))-methyltransferase RsmG [Pseudomonadota bacterium]